MYNYQISERKKYNTAINRHIKEKHKILSITLFSIIVIFFVSCSSAVGKVSSFKNRDQYEGKTDTLYLFDYTKIKIDETSSVGIKIKNCSLYLDDYDEMVIMGEIENISGTTITDIEITLNFLDSKGEELFKDKTPIYSKYLKTGDKAPFNFYSDNRDKFIDISSVKIGVNYNDYNHTFKGNVVVEKESYKFLEEFLVLKGRVVNIGTEKVKNIILLCTVYDNRGKVIGIKDVYIKRKEMMPGEEQLFELKILNENSFSEISDYFFQAFYEDVVKVEY